MSGACIEFTKEKTDVRINDYVDIYIPVLLKMHKKRLQACKTLGYEESADFQAQLQ
jgi:hypothetical protein